MYDHALVMLYWFIMIRCIIMNDDTLVTSFNVSFRWIMHHCCWFIAQTDVVISKTEVMTMIWRWMSTIQLLPTSIVIVCNGTCIVTRFVIVEGTVLILSIGRLLLINTITFSGLLMSWGLLWSCCSSRNWIDWITWLIRVVIWWVIVVTHWLGICIS